MRGEFSLGCSSRLDMVRYAISWFCDLSMSVETIPRSSAIFSRVCARGRGEIGRAAFVRVVVSLADCLSPDRFQTLVLVRSGTKDPIVPVGEGVHCF